MLACASLTNPEEQIYCKWKKGLFGSDILLHTQRGQGFIISSVLLFVCVVHAGLYFGKLNYIFSEIFYLGSEMYSQRH